MRASLPIAAAILAACSPPERPPDAASFGAVLVDPEPPAAAGYVLGQQAYIKASNTGQYDTFGCSVALSADGSTLAVSARFEDSNARGIDGDQLDNSASDAGAVYVFGRSGTTWSQQAYVKASNTDSNDLFGTALALSADGATLAVGALNEASGATGINGDQLDNSVPAAGAVYVFARSGATWSQQAYVKASNPDSVDLFGQGVALSGDGSTLAVGTASEDSAATGIDGDQADNSTLNAGAVYVFVRSGTTWSQQAYVKASAPVVEARFGFSVALSGDGSTLATSGHREWVYVFKRRTTWSQLAQLRGTYSEAVDSFGRSIALSSDGSILAVGAPGESSAATGVDGNQADESFPEAGAAYLFTLGIAWSQRAYIKASNNSASFQFGQSVALSADGSTLAVGAHAEKSTTTGINSVPSPRHSSGAVYVFH